MVLLRRRRRSLRVLGIGRVPFQLRRAPVVLDTEGIAELAVVEVPGDEDAQLLPGKAIQIVQALVIGGGRFGHQPHGVLVCLPAHGLPIPQGGHEGPVHAGFWGVSKFRHGSDLLANGHPVLHGHFLDDSDVNLNQLRVIGDHVHLIEPVPLGLADTLVRHPAALVGQPSLQ